MIEIDKMQFKRTIKRLILLRKYFGITQAEMASICQISNRTYQRIEYEESDISISILLRIANHFKIDATYFFCSIEYQNDEAAQVFNSQSEAESSILFQKLSEAIELFLKDKNKFKNEDLNKIYLAHIHYGFNTQVELGIKESIFSIKEHLKISDTQIMLGHDFILSNAHRIIIKMGAHFFREDGEIETVNVVKCIRKSWEDPNYYFITHKSLQQKSITMGTINDILKGLKFFYQDKILILPSTL